MPQETTDNRNPPNVNFRYERRVLLNAIWSDSMKDIFNSILGHYRFAGKPGAPV